MSSVNDNDDGTDVNQLTSEIVKMPDIEQKGSPTKFDLKRLRDSFITCVQPDNTLLLGEYVSAYEELCVFVRSLGRVFEWATKDLSGKLLVLKEHQRLDPINYKSIQSMILYEVESGRIRTRDTNITIESDNKPLPNGCRTLLRLHRALAFLSAFLTQMRIAPDSASSAAIAWNAYLETLARFHIWPVRYTIRAALGVTLPTRRDLIDKLVCERSAEEIDLYAEEIVRACSIIEQTTQKLFQAHQLSKLP